MRTPATSPSWPSRGRCTRRSLGWESVLSPDGYLTVESRVDHPSINNSMFPNLRLKDAIVDRISAETGSRPDSGPERRGVVVHLFWKGDRATIALNASGRKLADRGYQLVADGDYSGALSVAGNIAAAVASRTTATS